MSRIKSLSILALSLSLLQPKFSQVMAQAPAANQIMVQAAQHFQFASDGPLSQVWGRAPEVPRVFFPERLPAFFSRTIVLDSDFPREARLSWIFTGREGGFTVELSNTTVRVYQRYNDSYGLLDSHTANPERIVQETMALAPGPIHSVTVTLDAHLSLSVLVNGVSVVQQNCMLDVSRHQLLFQGPFNRHIELTGSLLALQATETKISIDATVRHQTIYGFGGSPSIPAYDSLSEEGRKEYWHILSRYNLLIDREYPMGTKLRPDMSNLDNLADAKPHYYGDDFPNGEVSDFAYNAQSLKLGGKVIYEMWALPSWATKDYTDPDGKEHKDAANPSAWARAMVTYARIEKERTGRAPDVIGIQNEVQEPKEISFEMVKTLRRELDAAGFKEVKIHMPDASNTAVGTEAANALRSDPDVWSKIDIAASHEYDYQNYFADPDRFDDQLKALRQAMTPSRRQTAPTAVSAISAVCHVVRERTRCACAVCAIRPLARSRSEMPFRNRSVPRMGPLCSPSFRPGSAIVCIHAVISATPSCQAARRFASVRGMAGILATTRSHSALSFRYASLNAGSRVGS